MRISDWSSDVCSSDLPPSARGFRLGAGAPECHQRRTGGHGQRLQCRRCSLRSRPSRVDCHREDRSEEHTSELQSLMRNSYAVFCLKTQTTTHNTQITQFDTPTPEQPPHNITQL